MKLTHTSGITGDFIKDFIATGRSYYSTIIKLKDGREYVAPSHEFSGTDGIKFIKVGYITNVVYMKVFSQDANFYKGLRISFDKTEQNVVTIENNSWLHFKPVAYLTIHISAEEFKTKYNDAIKGLNSLVYYKL